NDNRALGFDWFLGNFLMANKNLIGSGGTQPSLNGIPSTANPEGTFPGSALFGTATAPSTSDQLITSGLRSSLSGSAAPAIATFTGILTDPQFRVVIKALEQRDGADLLNEGQVTTLSGRQAEMQVVDIQTIVVGNQNNTGGGNGGTAAPATGGVGNVIQNQPIFINYNTQPLPFGSVL